MKTADLIPFLLLELYESDKYGFELTKNIETKSGGKIVIKQPTLYTLLKKLEKSKFITSYWQDSEIGGKRHYYKITDNGKMQLTTLPSYDVLMQNLLASEENAENEEETQKTEQNSSASVEEKEETKPSSPLVTIIPTSEVFKEENIDNSTVTEINQNNAEIVKEQKNDENFATNIVIAKFVEVKPSPAPDIKPTNNDNKNEIVDLNIKIKTNQNDVKYVDYINLKTSKEYKKSKTFSKLTILRSSLISLFIFGLLICFALLSDRFGTSMFYYSSFIIGSVVAIFYPILTAVHIDKITAYYRKKDYKFNMKVSLFIKFSLICLVLLIVLVYNIMIKNNSFTKILSIYNFTNFYVPILLASSLILDSLLAYILMSRLKK